MKENLTFSWNGRQMKAVSGDTVASALWRQGVLALGASRKRHRPLGVSGAYLQGVLVTVDGRPHARADQTLVTQGMVVRQQNVWPSARFDLLQLFQWIPAKWVRNGSEHPNFIPGGTRRFSLWEQALMFLAGEVALDPQPVRIEAPLAGHRLDVDVTVVGGGPAGRGAANLLATEGLRVVLVSRSASPGATAARLGADLPPLDPRVTLLAGHVVSGIYRHGRVALAAPVNPKEPATVILHQRLILATGRTSAPPLVPGHDLPGVLDADAALRIAAQVGASFGPVVVVGTGAHHDVAASLVRLGAEVLATDSVYALQRIEGTAQVSAVVIGGKSINCRAVVHAGPWLANPSLRFQASAAGSLRLESGVRPVAHVEVIGSAGLADESLHVAALETLPNVAVCPCMDATVDEIASLVRAGETHVEVLKRATSCGMGPCQGFPCWESMRAVISVAGGGSLTADRPTHRPPGRGITVEQAAGLDGLLELE